MTAYSKLRKINRRDLRSKNTPEDIRDSLALRLIGKCTRCFDKGITKAAYYRLFKEILCKDCVDQAKLDLQAKMLKKSEEESNRKNNQENNGIVSAENTTASQSNPV